MKRITVKDTFHQFLGAYLSMDGPLLLTIRHLFSRPGIVTRSFIEGRRQQYYKPVSYFIVLTAIYIILRSILSYDPLKDQIVAVPDGNPESIKENAKLAAQYMVMNIDNFLLILVLSFAAGMKLFFGKRYNYAEFLSMSFYTVGQYILMGTFIMIVQDLLEVRQNQLQLLILAGYMMHVMASTLANRKWYRWLAYLACALFSILLYVNLSFLIAYFIVTT
ncbi:MAG: DUF3667 domain-containing protein [Flavobacteriia bacterium]|nr:DUF3667 domain-containing protein [Flavobacteriia bacterium]